MNPQNEYIIHFKGLSQGVHEYKYDLDDLFFKAYEESEILSGKVAVVINLDKKPDMMELRLELDGTVKLPCDRCLDEFEHKIHTRGELFLKQGDPVKSNEEVIFYLPEEYKIRLSQYLYEFIQLSLPYRRIHPENNNGESLCNQEMLLKLAKFSAKDHGSGNDSDTEQENDPRWDDLKKLLEKNNK